MPTFKNNVTSGNAIEGTSVNGRGLVGKSEKDYGIRGHSAESAGIRGSSDKSRGVEGWATNSEGVVGVSTKGNGVWGQTDGPGNGVVGTSKTGAAVLGDSTAGEGVRGLSHSGHGAVVGINNWTPAAPPGEGGPGGWFESAQGEGVRGWSKTPHHGGVVGVNTAKGAGVYGLSEGGVGLYGKGKLAGFFEGDVEVKGDIRLVGADCAEQFDIADAVDAGTVMVLGEGGVLHQSRRAYDKCVAGVISGAGSYKPGIILDKQESETKRLPIGLVGKVYCKVDAETSPIEVGDLLTTSSTPGHAMRASDPLQAFGAVIGKALRSLPSGKGMIPILIALQ